MNYDIYLDWTTSRRCNFECDYCFHDLNVRKSSPIEPVNIKKLLNILKKTKKTYLVNLSGGEPFLIPNFIEFCKKLTEQHYISVVTNLSCTSKIKEFIEQISPTRVKSILASCHVLEHNKKQFIENYNLFKNAGFTINSSYVVYPPLLERMEKDIEDYRGKGIDLYTRMYVGKYKNKQYPAAYTQDEENRILKYQIFGGKESFRFKGTTCNAGYNAACVNPNGDLIVCYNLPLKIGNLYKKINFLNKMIKCPVDSCNCPLKLYSEELYKKACNNTFFYSPIGQKFLLFKSKFFNQGPNLFKKSIIKLDSILKYIINAPDRILGKIGLLIKKYNLNLYLRLKNLNNL